MATSFRRKKRQDERASEASDFLCTPFQMSTKYLETVSTLRNHFMFLHMVGKKDTNSFSETEANWTQNSLFYWYNFQFKNFLAFFTINRICMTTPLLWIMENCVLSRNTDNYKVWNKFWVIGNLLRWTPFVVFQTYSSPFFDQISFKEYLQPVIWGFTALWGQKNYKDRRISMKQTRTTEKWQPHSDEKSTKMKGLLRPHIFNAHNSKYVQSIWKQYRPLETILCFSRWSWKRTPTASQKQKQIGHKILFFSNPFPVQEFSSVFSHSIAFAWPSHYCESRKNVFCLGIPSTIKFETNFSYRKFA